MAIRQLVVLLVSSAGARLSDGAVAGRDRC